MLWKWFLIVADTHGLVFNKIEKNVIICWQKSFQKGFSVLLYFLNCLFLPNNAIGQFEKSTMLIGWQMWWEFKIVNRSRNTVVIRSEQKNRHFQKLPIDKKATIFVQSSWNLVKMIITWGNHFYQVSEGLNENCGLFTNGQFLYLCHFFLLRL